MIKKLAKIKEEQGLIAEAADLMQEVAVSILCLFGYRFHIFSSVVVFSVMPF